MRWVGLLAGLALVAGCATPAPENHWVAPAIREPELTVRRPTGHEMVIDYTHGPGGMPVDPGASTSAPLTEGLHPQQKVAVYDAPGGRPKAFLPATISGVRTVVPVVERTRGWTAVLLPSLDRAVGWLAPGGRWTTERFADQLVLDRTEHRLTWLRDGVRKGAWTVATGAEATPTPLGRTFVMGRTSTEGPVYAGLDALILGAVPERKEALQPGLRNGHTAIHSWYKPSVFGRSVSNGCIRIPADAQRTLLGEIRPGTPVAVIA